LLLLLSLIGLPAADLLTQEHAPLSATEILTLEHPAQFRYAVVREVVDAFRPAICLRLVNAQGSNSVVFKIFAGKILGDGPQSQAELDAAVQKMNQVYVPASIEKTNEVYHLKLGQTGAFGAYGVFTDASLVQVVQPPADQYRIITGGLVRIGGYLFTIRGGSNDKDGADYQSMLTILNSLKVLPRPPEDSSLPQQL
jgi:hypothetical protein